MDEKYKIKITSKGKTLVDVDNAEIILQPYNHFKDDIAVKNVINELISVSVEIQLDLSKEDLLEIQKEDSELSMSFIEKYKLKDLLRRYLCTSEISLSNMLEKLEDDLKNEQLKLNTSNKFIDLLENLNRKRGNKKNWKKKFFWE